MSAVSCIATSSLRTFSSRIRSCTSSWLISVWRRSLARSLSQQRYVALHHVRCKRLLLPLYLLTLNRCCTRDSRKFESPSIHTSCRRLVTGCRSVHLPLWISTVLRRALQHRESLYAVSTDQARSVRLPISILGLSGRSRIGSHRPHAYGRR